MIHDGWSPYDRFEDAEHPAECVQHLLRRADEMQAAAATRGPSASHAPVAELLGAGADLRDRHAAGEVSRHGLAVKKGRLENQLCGLIFPSKDERLTPYFSPIGLCDGPTSSA